jgi:hypothetical protein
MTEETAKHSIEQPIHSRYADGTPYYGDEGPAALPKYDKNHKPNWQRGLPVPDENANDSDTSEYFPHTRLRWDKQNKRIYQAREFDKHGLPVRDIDFTGTTTKDGKLRLPNEPIPHVQRWTKNNPDNPNSGYKRSRKHEPLN